MTRRIIAALLMALGILVCATPARATCDYDVGGGSPFLMTTLEAQLDEELACLTIGTFVQAFDADLSTFAAGGWTDPNADQIMWWDDSQGRMEFMALADMATEAAPAAGDYVVLYGAEGDARKVDWSSLPGAAGGIGNVVEDTSPTLGGNLEGGGFDLGTSGSQADDVFLSEGSVINWDAGDCTLTQTGNAVAFGGCLLTGPSVPDTERCVAASDQTTAITTGTGKVKFPAFSVAWTVTGVYAMINTASSSGTPAFDINEDPDREGGSASASILSTVITIDPTTERHSVSAAVPPVITDSALAANAEMSVDFDVAGTGVKGVVVCLVGHPA